MNSVVDADGLTADWLSSVLDRDVQLLSSSRFGTGQTSATYRLTVSGDGLPSSLVAKVAWGDEPARKQVKLGVRAEVSFYRDLLATVDLRTPRCWYAAVADDGLQFTLLLEDLAPCVAGVQAAGCTRSQAESAVRNLAALHAPRWNDPALLELRYQTGSSTPERATFMSQVTAMASEAFIDRYQDDFAAEDAETLRASAAKLEAWLSLPRDPYALLHGDYRLDNLLFDPNTDDVFAVDWQTLAVGPPTRDLSYFIGTCLEVDQRRATERQLVACYHEEIGTLGITDYPLEQCWQDYRLGQLQATMITTVGAAFASAERTAAADGMFLAMASRSAAAIRDLGTLSLVP